MLVARGPAVRFVALIVGLIVSSWLSIAMAAEPSNGTTLAPSRHAESPDRTKPSRDSEPPRHSAPVRHEQTHQHFAPPALHALALFSVMRGTEAYLWPEPFSFNQIDEWPKRYERAFTMPPKFDRSKPFMRWDGDPWEINVLGHALLGSELYLRPRRCGFGVLGSLAYATATSAVWEYGFEANGVRPSGVDLWYTPLTGLLLGEARLLAWRAAGGIDHRGVRLLIRALIDPLGEFSSGVLGAPC